ncbi:MAG: ATP-binding protein [Nanoarchaeota archaeon]|nr:ATP-binding protein [Nanoarchaeota archaeon]
MDKIEDFLKYIETTSLSELDKRALKYMIDFLKGNHIPEMADKSFLLEGEPGVGKTYLVEKLIKSLDLPIMFLGSCDIQGVNRVSSLKELLENLDNIKNGLIVIDDFRYALDFNGEFDEIDDKEKKRFMKLLEFVKRNNKKIVLLITLNSSACFDDSLLDRVEIKIKFDFPSLENKKSFLKNNFKNYTGVNELNYIAENSIGYSYRDLPQLIKMAYKEGNKKINMISIKKVISIYNPTSLSKWKVMRGVELNFKDVIGRKEAKKQISKMATYLKNRKKMEQLGVNRANLLLFSGEPGTGKTYMATALAGESGLPLIKISGADIFRGGNPINGISSVLSIAKRFENCVVFVDDVDKMIGRGPYAFGDEGVELGELGRIEDLSNETKGVVIFSVNNISRLGDAIRDRFCVINFPKPDFEERKEFIEKLINKNKLNLEIDLQETAGLTKNMSFREIQRLWNDCIFYQIENKEINMDVVRGFVEPKSRGGVSIVG